MLSALREQYARKPAHDPEKCAAVFPRDKRGTRLRGYHAQRRTLKCGRPPGIDAGGACGWRADAKTGSLPPRGQMVRYIRYQLADALCCGAMRVKSSWSATAGRARG